MTRFAALLALFLLPASTLLFSDAPGAASRVAAVSTSGTGTVSGHVFHDLNGDGVRDEGEPGLQWRTVQLVQNHNILAEELSASDGSYSMTDVPPGEYELVTALTDATQFCEEPGLLAFFDPLALFGCSPLIEQPWHPTTPQRLPVTVTGGSLEADFGGVPFDQSVLVGRAILEDDYAPPGALVEAVAGGRSCGSTTVAPPGWYGFPVFMLVILGEGERDGCPKAGQPVGFRVGGIDASQTVPFLPQIEQTSPARFEQGLDAMTDAAWYWVRQPSQELPAPGTAVMASVDGVPCGFATLESGPLRAPVTGFVRLIVPSNSVHPGCGWPGALVKFTVDGTVSETELLWTPGLQRISLSFVQPTQPPIVSPTPVVASPSPSSPLRLPEAGGSAARPQGGMTAGSAVVAGVAVVLLGSVALYLFKAREEDVGKSA